MQFNLALEWIAERDAKLIQDLERNKQAMADILKGLALTSEYLNKEHQTRVQANNARK